jgi:hypothetical protein
LKASPIAWYFRAAVLAIAVAGFALTLWIFYPGIMTWDAWYIHRDAMNNFYGDWQSPLIEGLWRLIDPLAPGPASMFLFIATLYWGAFAALGLVLARVSPIAALLAPILALAPPAFIYSGIIWRDIIFACAWLLAATLALFGARSALGVRLHLQVLALVLIGCGVLIRPNALFAAPIIAATVLWPTAFSWKRLALLFIPAMAAFYAIVPLVYYGAFGAQRQHPLQSLMVYDLGGITHFTQENQFPATWTPEQSALVLNRCYSPALWDVYWTQEPCLFVMKRLEDDKIFGTPAIPAAWTQALLKHPFAYLEHRADVFWTFLAGSNLTLWTINIENPMRPLFQQRRGFAALTAVHDALKPTPLFRTGFWLLLDVILFTLAWQRRTTPEGTFVLGVCGAAIIYVGTFFGCGVAADFRYGLLAVVAALGALPVLITAWRADSAPAPAR